MVALLLKAEEREDISAAIITAIIRPTNPVGRTLRTSLLRKKKTNQYVLIRKNCGHTPSDKKWLGTKTSNLSEHVYKESSKD